MWGRSNKDVLGLVIDHAVHTDQASIQQIYDVRRTVETRTVALAALRRSEPEAQAISGRAAAMRQAFSHPDEAMEHDIAFHSAIAVASRNPLFALIVGSFSVVTRRTWRIGWDSRSTDAERLANVECHRAHRRSDRSPQTSCGRGGDGGAFRRFPSKPFSPPA